MKKTILIVEDSATSMLLLEIILKQYNLIKAVNGLEAVNKYTEHCKKIDLILLDIKLPLLNGFQVFNKIKKINGHVSIIAQTANAMNIDKHKCLSNGFTDFITKPINSNSLLNTVKKYIN